MNAGRVYSDGFLHESFRRLQEERAKGERADGKSFATSVRGPELIDDRLLQDWLAINYCYALDLSGKETRMGDIGGIVPEFKGVRVLAIAEASMGKVEYGFDRLKRFDKTRDRKFISGLEEATEMPNETRNGVTVVRGTRNIAHYDFSAIAALQDPADLLNPDLYLLLGAEGFTVLSSKRLKNEQYTFNIPVNPTLFQEIKGTKLGSEQRIEIMRKRRNILLPEGFLAGFRFRYEGGVVEIFPIVARRDAERYMAVAGKKGLVQSQSQIKYIGNSNPDGSFGVLEKEFL